VDAATLRLPRARPRLELTLHAVAACLPAGGQIWVTGANDEGIKSTAKRLRPLFEDVQTRAFRRHVRVLVARRTDTPARGDLDDWADRRVISLPGVAAPVDVRVWPGLFAKGGLDPATALLLKHLQDLDLRGPVLDFGCGAGLIAMAVRARKPSVQISLLDVDALAVHAAVGNVPDAEGLCGEGWQGLPGDARFGCILSNPPLHRGKDLDLVALDRLISLAPQRLVRGGRLLLVSLRSVGPGRRMMQAFGNASLLGEDHRFQVWRSQKRKGR
jgi:16S rRNA (guanine1207-N2)-methyltransferase